MLRKVMKYEFLASGRQFLPAYIAVMGLGILNALLMWAGNDAAGNVYSALYRPTGSWAFAAGGLLMVFYYLIVFATAVLTVILIIRRFYMSLFKDEGYLTNTLPVSTDKLLLGKLLTAICWSIISTIVVTISFIIAMSVFFTSPWFELRDLFFFFDWGWVDFLGLLSSLVSLITTILAFYSALSIGQLAKRRKILLAIGAFFGMSFAFTFINTILALNIGFFNIGNFFFGTSHHSNPTSAVVLSIGIALAQGAIHYVIARHILKNKLNLE